ncbi:MAG: RNA 2',3'-cyclic phosphodiesterase [Bacteroidales bacterium]|nr:MAG: RNA 2',3'-cyclic phosphodiesterase [Bacteroidales bacterium]
MKRTFIAIDIPLESGIVGQIYELKAEFVNEKIKWVNPDQHHITIQFLGNVENSDIDRINESLSKITGNFSKFSLELTEFGVFKNLYNPRVFWIGFKPCDDLVLLQKIVADEMYRYGFEKPDKPFSPHLTIARIKMLKNSHKLKEIIDQYKGKVLQVIEVGEIILYESILKPQGPEYKVIKKHLLS